MRIRRIETEKAVLTAGLAAWYAAGPQVGYLNGGDPSVLHHALSMVSHAGVWHLLGNLFVLLIMRNRLYLQSSIIIAFMASFLPVYGPIWPLDGVTMGFSGVIFAIWGVKWGVYCQSFLFAGRKYVREKIWEFCVKAVPFALIGVVIPNVNWCLHLYCLLMGFEYGRWRWNRYRN